MRHLTPIDASARVLALQDEIQRSEESRYNHRLHALLLVSQGMTVQEAANFLGDSPRTIQYWVRRFDNNGCDGLREAQRPGRPSRLQPDQIADIHAALQHKPCEHGLTGNLWDGQTLATYIESKFAVELKARQCRNLLRKLRQAQWKPHVAVASSRCQSDPSPVNTATSSAAGLHGAAAALSCENDDCIFPYASILPAMKVVGLTGGIGMGKSTAAKLLEEMRIAVVDTDRIARELVDPGQPALEEIRAAFGSEIVAPDGRLRRGELARRVFANEEARKKLESILHPRIRKVWLEQIERWRVEQQEIGVVVIPLLFETNAAGNFDATVCVACSPSTQEQRLRERGWNAEQIEQRCRAQWAVEKKMESSDFVIWTEGELDVHRQQLIKVLQALRIQLRT